MPATSLFPPAYQRFVLSGVDLQPWTLEDDAATVAQVPDFAREELLARQCRLETGAKFHFYLFGRRRDRDDYAFFIVRNGKIEDKVLSLHLAFTDQLELLQPLRYNSVYLSFKQWVRTVAVEDMKDRQQEQEDADWG